MYFSYHFSTKIVSRYYSYGYCSSGNCRSNWDRWGRWIFAGILIFVGAVALLVLLLLAQRRRRRMHQYLGSMPMESQPPQDQGPYNYANAGAPPGATGHYDPNLGYAPPPGPPPQYAGGDGVTQPAHTYQPPENK